MLAGYCVALSLLCTSTLTAETQVVSIMSTPGLEYRFPLKMLQIQSLETTSKAMAKKLRSRLSRFASEYSSIMIKHFKTETEVQIVEGRISDESKSALEDLESDMAVLQYRQQICSLMDPWKIQLGGQPVFPEVLTLLDECVNNVIKDFEDFIVKLQEITNKEMRESNMELCLKSIKQKSKILNLTEFKVPVELERAFMHGPNSVPMDELKIGELRDLIERDLVSAAINFFRDENKVYPLVNQDSGLKNILEQLISQSPTNSKQVEFYSNLYEKYVDQKKEYFDKLSESHFLDSPEVHKMIPVGTILTTSDKGLGPCLLPIDWYIDQYKVQAQKGNHIPTNMSSEECIHFLKTAIDRFRSALNPEERSILKKFFANCNPNFRVGILKLVPKVHKLSVFTSMSWKSLPSRPIRGAENCPINPYSKALCKMLQDMHSTLKEVLSKNGIEFPVIYGCDEYSENIQKVEFERSTWSQKTLVSGDFSDAYTKSNLCDLQNSIGKLGPLAGWTMGKINLAKKLAGLVFNNCFFETPSGILKQTQGFPMGGHSSREGLDNILLSREIDLLHSSISKDLLFYYRLVDDISLAIHGNFSKVRSLLDKLAAVYPHAMPLNIQISFGYSHYLDSHVYNFLQKQTPNRFTTSLSYKPLSRFDYVPFNSNVAHQYKGNYKYNNK